MRQKGFTLIELLAVIVILAIIALIAMPMVLNTIDNARKGAAKSSALAYVNAVEQYMISSMLDSSKPQLQAGVRYQLSSTSYEVASIAVPEEVFINDLIELKGDKPESGYVIVTKEGAVDTIEMVMNNYPITCSGSSCEVVEEGEYEAYQVGDAVTIDGIGYHVTKTSSTINEYVTLLRDESIGDFAFDENGGTDFETSTLKTYLDTTYRATFGEKESYIKEITLLEFGEYEDTEDYNAGSIGYMGTEEGAILKDSPQGTMVDLYKNYNDNYTFFKFLRSGVSEVDAFAIEFLLTKTVDAGQLIYGIKVNSVNGINYTGILKVNANESLNTTIRPVVVISKKALD